MNQPLERENIPGKPHLKFIFAPHDERPELPDYVIEQISDSPYIFLEAVSFTHTLDDRQFLEDSYNLCLADPDTLSEDQNQTRIDYLSCLVDSRKLANQLVSHLAGSGKKLFLIDSDPSCDFFPLFEQVNYLRHQIFDHLIHNHFDLADQAHRKYVEGIAGLHSNREQLIHSQIEHLLQKLMIMDPHLQVAVIQGTVHSPTVNLFDPSMVDIESCIYGPLPPEPSLWLKTRLNQPVSDFEYLQALIVDLLFEDEKVSESVRTSLLKYTSEQLNSLINEFDLLYRQHLNRITNRRRLSEEAKEPYLPFVFHSTVQSLLHSLNLRIG